MSEPDVTTPPPDADDLRRRIRELEQLRARAHGRFLWYFIGGLTVFMLGVVIAASNDSVWGIALAAILGAALVGRATAFYAVKRGQLAAWGWLSILGLGMVVTMPDRNAARLDAWQRQLQGHPPREVRDYRSLQALLYPAAALGLLLLGEDLWRDTTENLRWGNRGRLLLFLPVAFALRGLSAAVQQLLESRPHGKTSAIPVALAVWAGLVTSWAGTQAWENYRRLSTDPAAHIIAGEDFTGELPRGWKTSRSLTPQGPDFVAENRSAGLSLSARAIPKAAGETRSLDQLATALLNDEQTSRGAGASWYGRRQHPVENSLRLQYTFRYVERSGAEMTRYYAFWQSARHYYIVCGTGRTQNLLEHQNELQPALDAVRERAR